MKNGCPEFGIVFWGCWDVQNLQRYLADKGPVYTNIQNY